MKINPVLENLLEIDIIIHDVSKFWNIKCHLENIDQSDPNYQKLLDQTNLLIKVLNAFGKTPPVEVK